VHVRPRGRARKGLDDVRRRPDLRIPAAEVDERLAVRGSGRSDTLEQRHEVLLRKALQPLGTGSHPRDPTS
jgi:hypothetical protein